jgi:NADPH:quinone reductase-like Zn-dependent oxidoreductase
MKIWQLQARPEAGSSILLASGEAPSAPLGPLDVAVRIHAVSLNYRDLLVARSARATALVPLSDGAGEVIEVGDAVTHLQRGDRVMANFFPYWRDGELSAYDHTTALGGGASDGMLREEVVLPAHAWVKVPRGWSFEEAAALPCAGLTAWQALFEVTTTGPGQTVLLLGTGGVSIFALQLALRAGAHVVITTQSPSKVERLQAFGAGVTVIETASTAGKFAEAVRVATGGRGVDTVVDVAGGATLNETLDALRFGGTAALVGVLSGFQGEIALGQILQKRLAIRGVYVGSVAMFERYVRALEAGDDRPMIDRVFTASASGSSTEDVAEAYAHLASGQHFGKVVLRLT